jgi:phytoene desaturase
LIAAPHNTKPFVIAGREARKRVAIIGAGLGGLSAAIHLRLAGCDVTIFEKNDLCGGRANLIEHRGFRFDTGPSLLNYPWVFEELFRAAGRNLYDYVTLLPVDPSVAFQWRDGKHLSLSSDQTTLIKEFSRFEPNAAQAVERFFADAQEKYRLAFEKLACSNEDNPARWLRLLSVNELLRTRMWRSLWSELSRTFNSRYIREALGSYGMYLGGAPYQLPGIFSILPYGEMAYGLWLPRGGIYALVTAIERLARELGITIRTGAEVTRIEDHGSGVSALFLANGERIPATVIVSNLDVPSTHTSLLAEPPPRMKMTPGVVTFYWGIKGRPTGLGHHTIFLPDDYRAAFHQLMREGAIPTDLPFYISIPSATDPSLAPPGDSCVFVLVPVPVLSQLGPLDWHATAAQLKATVLARLSHHGVTLKDDDFLTEHCYTPVDWQQRFGLYDGSAFGASHNLMQMGPFRAPNWSHTHPGLFFVGSSTTPGAGMPMVILSGRMVAERVLAHVH